MVRHLLLQRLRHVILIVLSRQQGFLSAFGKHPDE